MEICEVLKLVEYNKVKIIWLFAIYSFKFYSIISIKIIHCSLRCYLNNFYTHLKSICCNKKRGFAPCYCSDYVTSICIQIFGKQRKDFFGEKEGYSHSSSYFFNRLILLQKNSIVKFYKTFNIILIANELYSHSGSEYLLNIHVKDDESVQNLWWFSTGTSIKANQHVDYIANCKIFESKNHRYKPDRYNFSVNRFWICYIHLLYKQLENKGNSCRDCEQTKSHHSKDER